MHYLITCSHMGNIIINSRKPLKSMVFCNYQASLSILKFTLPGRNDPFNFLCQNFPLKLLCSYEWFCSITGHIKLCHIQYLFINFADFRFGQWLYNRKKHIFHHRRLILHFLTTKISIAFTCFLKFDSTICA